MPGRWDPNQNLDATTHQVEWPTGPLFFDSTTEAPTRLEAWVVQDSTGASQRTVQTAFTAFKSPGRWTADGIGPGLGWIQGEFQLGPATGIALVASHDSATNTDKFFRWEVAITLVGK